VLALAQAAWVRQKLEERYSGSRVEIVTIKTGGDRFFDAPAEAIPGKGVFVKEIDEALLAGRIDLAVHSMKDLPVELSSGLEMGAVPEREDPSDVLVCLGGGSLQRLKPGARIGTESLRRRAQILYYRGDLVVVGIRGNIDTRLRKLEEKEVDGLILALAGLKRIGQTDRVSEVLPPEVCLSAPGQGALCLEVRRGDPVGDAIAFLRHAPTAFEVLAERSLLRHLGGGCQIPIGARAWASGNSLRLSAVVADPDGRRLVRGEVSGEAEGAEELGHELARQLFQKGARELLAAAPASLKETGA
jgi:hydroxymethylbilane synthase